MVPGALWVLLSIAFWHILSVDEVEKQGPSCGQTFWQLMAMPLRALVLLVLLDGHLWALEMLLWRPLYQGRQVGKTFGMGG